MLPKEEKYLIINNVHQFMMVVCCNYQIFMDYIKFGHSSTLEQGGVIDLFQLLNSLLLMVLVIEQKR
jgi:hypothetical protein